MERATEIKHAITQVMGNAFPRDCAIGRGEANRIAGSVFNALEGRGFLNTGPPTDREIRITHAITEAIGHVRETPGAYGLGQWVGVTMTPSDLAEVTDAVYRNLVHWGYLTEATS
jgi:hypothetical protein